MNGNGRKKWMVGGYGQWWAVMDRLGRRWTVVDDYMDVHGRW